MDGWKRWFNNGPEEREEFVWPREGWPLFKAMVRYHWGDTMQVSLFFCLFSLPLLTAPASLAAASRLMMKMLMDRPMNSIWREFWWAFKENFKPAMTWGWIWEILFLFFFYFTLVFGTRLDGSPLYFLLFALCLMLLFLVWMAGFYLFPMMTTLELSSAVCWKNAFLLAVGRLNWNIPALAGLAVLLGLVALFFPVSIAAYALFLAGFMNLITTFCAYEGLRKYVIRDASGGGDEGAGEEVDGE